MKMLEDIPLAQLTTFRMGPRARFFAEIASQEDVPEALDFAKERGLPWVVLGGGSNTIFTADGTIEAVVLHVRIPGFEMIEEGESVLVRVGAGEEWDGVVARTVDEGLAGIEALSAIPGSSGATPVQNVGAYGVEIADVLTSVEAYDTETDAFVTLAPEECGFSYRDSRFKRERRYLITGITMRLTRDVPRIPDYPGVRQYLEANGFTEPGLADIRETIIAIRAKKLPDPKVLASVGSFFKNPVVPQATANRIRERYPDAVVFALPDGNAKVGAGWMIDTLGLKGKSFGNLGLYESNALVVVNEGGAAFAELQELITDIQRQVRDAFGIDLEPEPVFV